MQDLKCDNPNCLQCMTPQDWLDTLLQAHYRLINMQLKGMMEISIIVKMRDDPQEGGGVVGSMLPEDIIRYAQKVIDKGTLHNVRGEMK